MKFYKNLLKIIAVGLLILALLASYVGWSARTIEVWNLETPTTDSGAGKLFEDEKMSFIFSNQQQLSTIIFNANAYQRIVDTFQNIMLWLVLVGIVVIIYKKN